MKDAQTEQALGRSRGGFSCKIHATVDALGYPVRIILTGGQAHDIIPAAELIDGFDTGSVLADRGYDSDNFLHQLEQNGIIGIIPPRKNRKHKREYDPFVYRERHLVECFFNKIKHFRRIFSRFEKLAQRYKAFIAFVSVLIWLK